MEENGASSVSDFSKPGTNDSNTDDFSDISNTDSFEIRMLLTNARSLSPKIKSLIEMFDELDLHFAVVTESWLKDGEILDRDIIDLEYGTQLKIIYKNRPVRAAGARQVGGGVSIIYSKNKCSFRERRIASKKFELVVAIGKIGGLNRSIAVFGVYIQPKMKVGELQELREIISDQILEIKANSQGEGPVMFIGGDMNRRDLGPAFSDFIDIAQINHSPTRGEACLDIVYSNVHQHVARNFRPLATEQGVGSDHDCVVVFGGVKQERNFVWKKKTARKHTQAACDDFACKISEADWSAILGDSGNPDILVERYEAFTTNLVDGLFPFKTVRVRSNEQPWVTDGIRKLSKRKKKAYKRRGKSRLWAKLQDKLNTLVEHSRSAFVEKIHSQGGSTKAFYQAVKTLTCKDKPEQWRVESLFPSDTPKSAGNKIAEYFTEISNQFDPLSTEDLTCNPRRPVTVEEVRSKLKAAKKPNSSVPGDLLPRLMKKYYHLLSVPVSIIFNAVFATGRWPAAWKKETAVVIPKVPNPSTLAECRNIAAPTFSQKCWNPSCWKT